MASKSEIPDVPAGSHAGSHAGLQSPRNGILTFPNLLTALRALGVPLFLFTFLKEDRPTLSFFILTVGAITDYFDGKVARWLNQESAFGAAFDPFIDRLYIVATILAMAIKGYLPWWLVVVLLARDSWMVVALSIQRRRHGEIFRVTYLGKAATFSLLYAFPFILLQGEPTFGPEALAVGKNGGSESVLHGARELFHIIGWAFSWWGIALYLLTAFLYTRQALSKPGERTNG